MAVDPLIELRDVNKYSGGPHVPQDIDPVVGKGEVVVVIGPRGRWPLLFDEPRPPRLPSSRSPSPATRCSPGFSARA